MACTASAVACPRLGPVLFLLAVYVHADSTNHYKTLSVPRKATQDEIKTAYRRLAVRYHPDKQSSGTEEQRAVAKAMFSRVADAHETLADAGKRRVYDFTLPRAGGARRAGADSFTPGWGRRSSV